jgi:hypothetical protein
MNPYTCDECDWQYVWTMGDRVKAVKRHQLAHLLERRDLSDRSVVDVPSYRLIDDLDERLRAVGSH